MSNNRVSLNDIPRKNRKPTPSERERQVDHLLATRYDALNQLIAQAEQQLKALKPIHSVWVDYNHDDGHAHNQPEAWEILGIIKLQDKWRLCHARDHEMNDDGELYGLAALVDCPVEVRVRAAKEIRRLQEAIVKSKEAYIPQVDEAIKELTHLCNEG